MIISVASVILQLLGYYLSPAMNIIIIVIRSSCSFLFHAIPFGYANEGASSRDKEDEDAQDDDEHQRHQQRFPRKLLWENDRAFPDRENSMQFCIN